MTELGALIGSFAVMAVPGSVLGGALADRLGRKRTLLFGLAASAMTSLLLGWAESFAVVFLTLVIVGLFAEVGGPARQAMVADLLPEEQRGQGFGLLRVVHNLAVAIGPLIGGLIATRSFFLLFVADAVSSLITAGVVSALLHETSPKALSSSQRESVLQTLQGYSTVLRQKRFTAFVLASMLVMAVSMQMSLTLPVYLRDVHNVSPQGFSYIMSLNATMVVLLQFAVTRLIRGRQPLLVAALGAGAYGLGYLTYGVVSAYVLFLAAMVVVTTGEMLFHPTAQAFVAQMAPEDMRGRYMAAYGFSWAIPAMVGPLLSGLIMDNMDPRWVWYATGLVGMVAAAAFVLLQQWMPSAAAGEEVAAACAGVDKAHVQAGSGGTNSDSGDRLRTGG
jgi:MFS family permease